jgi:hypothetical protein
MANVVNALARFYPVDGQLNKEHFNTLYGELRNQLWRSWYYFNESERCIDVIYPCKHPVSQDLYENEEILSKYHVWIRVADYSCYEDFIGFKSRTYKPELKKIDYKCHYWAGFTDKWNYASSCFYNADELQIKFNTDNNSFLDKLIQHDMYNQINKELNSDLIWSHKMMIAYMKSSQTTFENDCTGEHIEENYYESEFNWALSHVWATMVNDNRVRLKEEILDPMHKYDENYWTIKIDNSIDEILFKLNDRVVQSFKWIEKENEWNSNHWEERTISNWDNCINPEFIEFRTWYRNKN